MLVTVDNCGAGIAADLSPEELGSGVWSSSLNVRFNNGYAERFKGTTQAFDTPSVTLYFLTPYATTTARYWVHAGLTAVYVDDGTQGPTSPALLQLVRLMTAGLVVR